MPTNEPVRCIELSNRLGMSVAVLSYGGVIQSLRVPDRAGRTANVVLGFAELMDYLDRSPYFGAIIGRYANRIRDGKFELDGTAYELVVNDPPSCLHGGTEGFDRKLWDVVTPSDSASTVRLTHTSPDGDQGFPGRLETTVDYCLSDSENTLRVVYQATTDRPTIVNLTNHSYFNLGGEGHGSVLGHEVEINADSYLPIDDKLLPLGRMDPVAGTPFDFRDPYPIGARIRHGDVQLQRGKGYDHTFVLNEAPSSAEGLRFAARVRDPESGRVLEIWTTEPGVDFYSGNLLDGGLIGTGGASYRQGDAFALEPEHFIDSPNIPWFPSTVLRPGEVYRSVTEYRFSCTD
jgi:aldose 1-epimerase